jgi:hypothetical protein
MQDKNHNLSFQVGSSTVDALRHVQSLLKFTQVQGTTTNK